ncbi:MAG: hypothetical protein ACOZAN_01610 [Patescibacteria group bacterium]
MTEIHHPRLDFDGGNDSRARAEQDWVIAEATRRTEQGSDFIVTPHAREKLNRLKEAFRRGNRVVIVEGPPGTGKSQLLYQLVIELMKENPEILGYSRTQGAPGLISADLLVQPRVTPKTSAEDNTFQALENNQELMDKIIGEYVQLSIGGFLNNLPPDVRRQKIDLFLKKIGVKGAFSETGELILEEDQSEFLQFLEDKRLRQNLGPLVDKKILALAMELGLLVIIDEANMVRTPNGLGLQGLENAFTVKPGEIFNFDGLFVIVDKVFGVFMTTNSIDEISPAIARFGRSGHLTMNADSGDMAAAARVLLTDEKGKFILSERKRDESELCRLIWWLEDLNLEGIDVSLNLVTPLCKLMAEGMDFRQAFQQIVQSLKREEKDYLISRIRGSFQSTAGEDEEAFGRQSLSQLNCLYNSDVFGNERKEALVDSGFRAEFNQTTGTCFVTDGNNSVITEHQFKIDGSITKQISSPDGKLLIMNSEGGLIVIDTVLMQAIPVLDSKQIGKDSENIGNERGLRNIEVHEFCWANHNQLLAVIKRGSNWEVALFSKVKQRAEAGESPISFLKIEESRKIEQPQNVLVEGKQLIVDDYLYSVNQDDLLNPLARKKFSNAS